MALHPTALEHKGLQRRSPLTQSAGDLPQTTRLVATASAPRLVLLWTASRTAPNHLHRRVTRQNAEVMQPPIETSTLSGHALAAPIASTTTGVAVVSYRIAGPPPVDEAGASLTRATGLGVTGIPIREAKRCRHACVLLRSALGR